MKRILLILLIVVPVISCKDDDNINQRNPYLINPYINVSLQLTLPQYEQLNYPGNNVVLSSYGIRGIVIYNENNSNYHVFELSDPNHAPSDCSSMSIEGIHATCTCVNEGSNPNQYNIVTGQHLANPGTMYPMQRYRAVRSGNVIKITNN